MAPAAIVQFGLADGTTVHVVDQSEPNQSYARPFVTIFSEEMAHIARSLKHASTLRVLLVLPMHLSFTQFRRLDQRKLAAELEMAQASISVALSELHEIGATERRGRGPVTEWMLSPDWGWNGKAGAWKGKQRTRGRDPAGRVQMPTRPGFKPVAAAEAPRQPAPPSGAKAVQRKLRLLSNLKSDRHRPPAGA